MSSTAVDLTPHTSNIVFLGIGHPLLKLNIKAM